MDNLSYMRTALTILQRTPRPTTHHTETVLTELKRRIPYMEWSADPKALITELDLWIEIEDAPTPTAEETAREKRWLDELTAALRRQKAATFIKEQLHRIRDERDIFDPLTLSQQEEDEIQDPLDQQQRILMRLAGSQ
ncbi:MAG: hypothetical protein OXC95_08885 [Dehalococcoidia bacterium]|nr:hypothetical protein [Dehalococcoidia bacterium]